MPPSLRGRARCLSPRGGPAAASAALCPCRCDAAAAALAAPPLRLNGDARQSRGVAASLSPSQVGLRRLGAGGASAPRRLRWASGRGRCQRRSLSAGLASRASPRSLTQPLPQRRGPAEGPSPLCPPGGGCSREQLPAAALALLQTRRSAGRSVSLPACRAGRRAGGRLRWERACPRD